MPFLTYNPTSGPTPKELKMAARDRSLENSTIGLIDNGKRNSDYILNTIGNHLKATHGAKDVIYFKKKSFSHPIPDIDAQRLSEQCDFIISGVGD